MTTNINRAEARIVKMLSFLQDSMRAQRYARTLPPGSRGLERLSTRELVRETVIRYRERGSQWEQADRDRLAAEYRRRNLPTAAGVVAGTATIAGLAVMTVLDEIHDQPEVHGPADVDAAFDAAGQDVNDLDALVNPDPMTHADRLADAHELGIDEGLVIGREPLDALGFGGVEAAPAQVSATAAPDVLAPVISAAPAMGM